MKPNHYEYAVMANEVYYDSGGHPPEGWQAIKDEPGENPGYHDNHINLHIVAYRNKAKKAVVIAFRGTEEKTLKDWIHNNIKLIFEQDPGSLTPMKMVVKSIIKEMKDGEKLYLTGHSLGAVLAEITAWYFKEVRESMTFESPGSKLYTLDKKPSPSNLHLEMVTYLTVPNAVNMLGEHTAIYYTKGKAYRIHIPHVPPLSSPRWGYIAECTWAAGSRAFTAFSLGTSLWTTVGAAATRNIILREAVEEVVEKSAMGAAIEATSTVAIRAITQEVSEEIAKVATQEAINRAARWAARKAAREAYQKAQYQLIKHSYRAVKAAGKIIKVAGVIVQDTAISAANKIGENQAVSIITSQGIKESRDIAVYISATQHNMHAIAMSFKTNGDLLENRPKRLINSWPRTFTKDGVISNTKKIANGVYCAARDLLPLYDNPGLRTVYKENFIREANIKRMVGYDVEGDLVEWSKDEVGPDHLVGFYLKSSDEVNTFVGAVATQMQLINYLIPRDSTYIDYVRNKMLESKCTDETLNSDFLCFIRAFSDLVLGIVDNIIYKETEIIFSAYYYRNGKVMKHSDDELLPALPIIRILYNGNEYFSVKAHRSLWKGAIKDPFLTYLQHEVPIIDSQLSDLDEDVMQQSLKEAEKKGVIGPRALSGFILEDVDPSGNCFYLAVAEQMKLIDHNHIKAVPTETDAHNSLRLAVQKENFLDREWAEDSTFDSFVTEFPDVILAIVDTRYPEKGFTCYYIDIDGAVTTNNGAMALELPNRPIIRLAATGNHFLSVQSHVSIEAGAITSGYNKIQQESIGHSEQKADGVYKREVKASDHSPTEKDKSIKDVPTGSPTSSPNSQPTKSPTWDDRDEFAENIMTNELLIIMNTKALFGEENKVKIGELKTDALQDEHILSDITKIEAVIGKEALGELVGWHQYVSKALSNNPLSEHATKVIQAIGNLVNNLEEWLGCSSLYESIDTDNQVVIILAQLEGMFDFIASGITHVGLPARYPDFDPDYGFEGGSDRERNANNHNYPNHEYVLPILFYEQSNFTMSDEI